MVPQRVSSRRDGVLLTELEAFVPCFKVIRQKFVRGPVEEENIIPRVPAAIYLVGNVSTV